MSIPDITLTEEQARDLVAKRDKEIADLMNRDPNPQTMIDLQKLTNRRNQAYEHLTTMLKKQRQETDGIIHNMR